MITSSFSSINALVLEYNAPLAPAVTIIDSGYVSMWFSFFNLWDMASRSSIIPMFPV